jgi:hypothetical protein
LIFFLNSRQIYASIAGLLQVNLTKKLIKITARETFIKLSSGYYLEKYFQQGKYTHTKDDNSQGIFYFQAKDYRGNAGD